AGPIEPWIFIGQQSGLLLGRRPMMINALYRFCDLFEVALTSRWCQIELWPPPAPFSCRLAKITCSRFRMGSGLSDPGGSSQLIEGDLDDVAHLAPPSIRARMSSTRQTVMRGPSLIGFGNRPDATPAHHVDRLTGIGPRGARIDDRRTKPIAGNVDCLLIALTPSIEGRSDLATPDSSVERFWLRETDFA